MKSKANKKKNDAQSVNNPVGDAQNAAQTVSKNLTKDLIDAIDGNMVSPNAMFPFQILAIVIEAAQQLLIDLMEHWHGAALTTADRQRLLGSGVRRYGFIDKTSDIATDNPEFVPSYLNIQDLKDLIRRIEMLREVNVLLRQATRVNMDYLLTTGSEAYRLSLMYYNAVKEASRMRVPGAQELFKILQPFFRMPGAKHDEPTEHEVERDARALLKGRKEGRIVIENEADKVIKGNRVVIDETHKSHEKFKETESGEIDE